MNQATAIGLGSASLAVAVLGKVGYDITKDAQMLAKERDNHTIDGMTVLARQNIKHGREQHEAEQKKAEQKKAEVWKAERQEFLKFEKKRQERQQRQMKLKKEKDGQRSQQMIEQQVKRQQELRYKVENSV